MERFLFATSITLILLAGCGETPPAPSPGQYMATADAAQRLADVAAGTTRQAEAQATANAAYNVAATAGAAAATREALAAQQQGTAAAIEATREGYEMQGQALSLRGTEVAIGLIISAATSTAEYQELRTAEELKEADMLRRQQADDFRRVQRSKVVAMLALYVGAASILAIAAVVGFELAQGFKWRQKRPIYTVQGSDGSIIAVSSPGWQPMAHPRLEAPRRPQLPPPSKYNPDLPAADQIPRPAVTLPVMRTGHILIVGAAGTGKSNVQKGIALDRRGLLVIDPHYRPGTWPDHAVVFSEDAQIQKLIMDMDIMLDARIEAGRHGEISPPNKTVIVDELPVLANRYGREIWDTFRRWLLEARKYNLFLVLGTQTTQVRSLGLEGQSALFENVKATIYLGRQAIIKRPELAGQPRPALIQFANNDPVELIIPYLEHLDPESRSFVPPAPALPPEAQDAEQFNQANLSELTSRNKAALWLAGRDGGRASGQEYERLDAALKYRAEVFNCLWAQGLINKEK